MNGRVTIEDIDDRDLALHEGEEVDLTALSTEDGMRYLVSHGTPEMDARFLVAMAKGQVTDDARPGRMGSDARSS